MRLWEGEGTCLSSFSTTGHDELVILDMVWEMMGISVREMMGDGEAFIPGCSHHV